MKLRVSTLPSNWCKVWGQELELQCRALDFRLRVQIFSVARSRLHCEAKFSDLGFQVSSFRIRVSGFGFRVSDFGFRVSGFGFRVSGFGM